jgi:hypothetical protein
MSKPLKDSRSRAKPYLAVLVIVLTVAIIGAVFLSLLESIRFTREWKPQVTVDVAGQGTFEYGWIPEAGLFDGPWGRGDSTYLVWNRIEETRRFRINDGGDPLGRHIRVYLAKSGEGLWIEDARDDRFFAALEFGTGRFWDINLLPGFNDDTGSTVQRRPQWTTRTASKQIYPAKIVPAPSW